MAPLDDDAHFAYIKAMQHKFNTEDRERWKCAGNGQRKRD